MYEPVALSTSGMNKVLDLPSCKEAMKSARFKEPVLYSYMYTIQ